MTYLIRYWTVIVFTLSLMAISSALFAEYILNLLPCKMCLYQRQPYYFILIIVILFYLFKKTSNIWLYILTEIAVFYGLFYSIWHVGIEKKLISGPANCSGTIKKTVSIEQMKEQILNQAIVNCNEISWSILGFSAATINTIFLLLLLLLNTTFIIKVYYKNEKNK